MEGDVLAAPEKGSESQFKTLLIPQSFSFMENFVINVRSIVKCPHFLLKISMLLSKSTRNHM